MKRWAGWAIAIADGVGGSALVAGSIYAKGLFSDSTAAWVQGVGTIWAILVAWWFSAGESRRAENLRRAEAIGRIETILHVANEAREIANYAVETLKTGVHLPDPDFEDVREAIDRLPSEQMQSGKLAVRLRQLRRQLSHLAQSYAAVTSHRGMGLMEEDIEADFTMRVARIHKKYGEIDKLCEELSKRA